MIRPLGGNQPWNLRAAETEVDRMETEIIADFLGLELFKTEGRTGRYRCEEHVGAKGKLINAQTCNKARETQVI